MRVFLTLTVLVHSKDRALQRQLPCQPLCWAWSCVQRTCSPTTGEIAAGALTVNTGTHLPCCLDPHLGRMLPSRDFFPSRIFFSASYITPSSLGMWPWIEKKHMLLVVLSTNSAGAFSRSGTWGDLKMCFLPDRTEREEPRIVCFSLKAKKHPGSQKTPLILKDGESRPWIPMFQNAQMDLGKVSPDVAEGRPGLIQTESSVLPFLHNPDVEIEGPLMSQVPSLQEEAAWGKAGQSSPLEARWGCSEIIIACCPSALCAFCLLKEESSAN